MIVDLVIRVVEGDQVINHKNNNETVRCMLKMLDTSTTASKGTQEVNALRAHGAPLPDPYLCIFNPPEDRDNTYVLMKYGAKDQHVWQ